MLTFDQDDNDDDMSFDNKSNSSPQPASPFSRPTTGEAQKPAPKQPANPVQKPVVSQPRPPVTKPEVKKTLPSAPLRTEQASNFPSRPAAKPEAKLPTRPAPRQPVRQEPVYEEPSYEEPTYEEQAYEPEPEYEEPDVRQPSYEEPARQESLRQTQGKVLPQLTEAEAYLLSLNNGAPNPNIAQGSAVPDYQPGYQQSHPYNQQPPRLPSAEHNYDPNFNANSPQPLQTADPEDTGKSRKGRKGKAVKHAKTAKAEKPVKEKPYDGARKKILWVRLGVGLVGVVVLVAGMRAIFLPETGPSKEQVMSAAQEAVNYTGFPAASGEQFAIDFTRTYFNFNNRDSDRKVALQRFASDELITKIEIKTLSNDEYQQQNPGASYNDYLVSQTINYGPYVVSIENLDDKNSVFTVKVGLNNGTVYYLDVPVKYDPEQYSLTLAGPPSFTKPIQNSGKTEATEYTVNFGSGDKDIQNSFSPDLQAYLKAWAASDSTIVNRYTMEKATDNAKRGLQNSVQFYSLDKFLVEPADEAKPATATVRRAEITVTWNDPSTGLKYPQQYRMLLTLNPEGNWSIYDIENFSVLN